MKFRQFPGRKQRTAVQGGLLAGQQSGAERPHEAGNVKPQYRPAQAQLQRAQQSVIVKGSALRHDMLPEFIGIGDLDDLVQGIFDHRIGEPGGDVAYGSSLLLRLLDARVHEHCAARAEIHGMLCLQRFGNKGGQIHAQ